MTATAMARALAEAELERFARATFPGVTDLGPAEHATSAMDKSEPLLTGSWEGVYLVFAHWGEAASAAAAVRCNCCGRFSQFGRAVSSPAAFARAHRSDPPATTECCWACRWLHDLQDRAARTTSRPGRWWFQKSHRVSVADVLARHRRAA